MCESVRTHDGLVRLDWDAGDLCHQPARAHDLFGVNSRVCAEEVFPRAERHHNLFHGAISCPLADAVDRALHLLCPVPDRCECVRNSQPQVVMAVDRNDGFVDVLDLAFDAFNERSEFLGHGITCCVRDIDGLRTCCDHRFHDLMEVCGVCPCSVHR